MLLRYVLPVLMLITACEEASETEKSQLQEGRELRYLALGDSYTIGESVESKQRYPVQLIDSLRASGLSMANAEIIATTGWTTLDLGNGIDTTNPQGPYDLVSLLIGVNDQYQGKDIAHYPERFTTLLNRAVTLAGGRKERVFVLSIPDYAYTPFGQTRDVERISREIDAYNDINRRVTREMDITYFDITPVSRNGLAQPDLVASDGLHPSGSMYQQWVAQMVSVIKQKLD